MSWQEDNGEKEEGGPGGLEACVRRQRPGVWERGANLVRVSAHLRNQAQCP